MAQKKKAKKDAKKEIKQKGYKKPTQTHWGRILILVLTAAMALVSVAMLIYYIVILATNV